MTPPEEITVWLARWREGDQHARDQVFGVVHSRLREIAANLLQGQRGDHTLEPNALVNELCIRLFGNQKINYNDRGHFFAVAAQTMRRILIDYARAGFYADAHGLLGSAEAPMLIYLRAFFEDKTGNGKK